MSNLSGWPYYKVISLTGQAGSGTYYQVKITIGNSDGGDFNLGGHCTNFPQDIQITDDDGITLLKHWVVDLKSNPIVVYVKVADDLSHNQNIRVYYGKSGETTSSCGADTFEFFDTGNGHSDGDELKATGGWIQGNAFNGNGVNEYSNNIAYVTYGCLGTGNPIKIGVVTDIENHDGSTTTELGNFVSAMNNTFQPSACFELGDIIADNNCLFTKSEVEDDLDEIEAVYDDLDMDRFYILGNHCLDFLTKAEFFSHIGDVVGNKYQSFDIGDYHCIILDAQYNKITNLDEGGSCPSQLGGHIPPVEKAWLENDLNNTSKKTIVFVHQIIGNYVAGHSVANTTVDNRTDIRTIFENSGKVILVAQGTLGATYHERINRIDYISLNYLNSHANGAWFEITIDPTDCSININGENTTSYNLTYADYNYVSDPISLHLEDLGGEVYHSSDLVTIPQLIECELYVPSTDIGTSRSYFSIYEGSSSWAYSNGASLLSRGTKWYVGYGGTEYVTTKPLTVGWHRLTIKVKSDGSADMYIDDELLNVSVPATTLDNNDNKVALGTHNAGHHSYFDVIKVRKYNDPEPSFASDGAEQTSGTNILGKRNSQGMSILGGTSTGKQNITGLSIPSSISIGRG